MLTIRESIKKIVQDENEIYSVYATVNAVDEEARTIEATPLNGAAKLFDIRLQASENNTEGVLIVPVVDSVVLITFTTKDTGFVSLCEKVEKILIDTDEVTFNGGDNGGLIIIQNLVDKINALEDLLNSLVTDYKTHTHNAPQAPTGTIPTTPLLVPFTGLNITPTTTVADLENDKITH